MAEAPAREIGDVTVSALMSRPARTVRPETTIEELTELMTLYDYNGFPVVDGDDVLQGLVTRTDLFKLYLEPFRRPAPAEAATVATIMSRGVIVVRPEERVLAAIALMVEHHVITIPVVASTARGPQVVGVITRRDAAGALKPQHYYCERSWGGFARMLTLPTTVEADRVEATFKKGVLAVHLPKAKEAKGKKVEIKAA